MHFVALLAVRRLELIVRGYLLANDIKKIVDPGWSHKFEIIADRIERGIKICLGSQVVLK
jgi:hypothetical protein